MCSCKLEAKGKRTWNFHCSKEIQADKDANETRASKSISFGLKIAIFHLNRKSKQYSGRRICDELKVQTDKIGM